MIIFNRPTPPVTELDPRAVDILELIAVEGISLRMSIDLILWFEDRGYVVDLRTETVMKAEVERITPSGYAVNHLLTPDAERDVERCIDSLFTRTDEAPEGLPEPNGTLTMLIDYGAEVQDLIDAREDEEFNRRGGW